MQTEKVQWQKIFSVLIIVVLCSHVTITGFIYAYVGFDGGWNAEVAKNFALYGKYAVSFPESIEFYYVITTGQPMILPVALAYKLFGVSSFSTALVPLLYSVGLIVALFFLTRRLLNGFLPVAKEYIPLCSAAVVALLYVMLDFNDELSYQVVGEYATAFFLALAVLFFMLYTEKNSLKRLFFVGFFAAFAFMTKTVAVCFLIVAFLLILFYFLFIENRSKPIKKILFVLSGFFVGFLLCDLVKLIAFRFNLVEYFSWWITEIKYCFILNGSSGANLNFFEKLSALANVFFMSNPFCVLILIADMVIPFVLFFRTVKLVVKKDKEKISFPYALMLIALSGESYLVAVLLIGNGAAISKRRTFVHSVFFALFTLIILSYLLAETIQRCRKDRVKKNAVKVAITSLVALSVAVFSVLPSVLTLGEDRAYGRKCQDSLIEQVLALPDNAYFTDYKEHFSPDISLLTDIQIHCLSDEQREKLLEENTAPVYYIAGGELVNEEIYERYTYRIVYRESEDSMYYSIVELTGVAK